MPKINGIKTERVVVNVDNCEIVRSAKQDLSQKEVFSIVKSKLHSKLGLPEGAFIEGDFWCIEEECYTGHRFSYNEKIRLVKDSDMVVTNILEELNKIMLGEK